MWLNGGRSHLMNQRILHPARLSLSQRLALPFRARLRRAHRLFRSFPACPYETFLDVGAYAGEFTDSLLTRFDPRQVWLVEADPEQAAQLQRKYAGDSRCQVVPAAVTDRTGVAEFRVNEHRPSSSVVPIAAGTAELFHKSMAEARVVRVPALSLDDLFAQHQLPVIDLMKVDIQGAERLLVAGGARALTQVRQLFMEVWFEECYHGAALFPELHQLLAPLGFKLRSFHEFRKGPDGNLVYTNALYVQPGLLARG
jgi:FkbM family methyltransferase